MEVYRKIVGCQDANEVPEYCLQIIVPLIRFEFSPNMDQRGHLHRRVLQQDVCDFV